MSDIVNSQDILDSRDVIARRDELAEEREALAEALADLEADTANDPQYKDADAQRDTAKDALAEWDADNAEELAALEAFIQDGSAEWDHGVTLVRETYFEDYAQELADDLGAIPKDARWPLTCIDWEHAARELRYDYTGADFDGVTYYYQG